jgi:succinate dehydrogenase / fumarate reductase iron-sulfur subunit
MSFLEMLDVLNEQLIAKGEEPIAFDSDCREGICGMCGLMINGNRTARKARRPASCTCAVQGRRHDHVEPWRADAFPVLKDLVVDRGAFDRIIQAGGFISVNTGSAPDANAVPVPKRRRDRAFNAAACIGCGACVAACPNASAMLFMGAKVTHLGELPQGQPERWPASSAMVAQHDHEGFGGCTNIGACAAACPKEIPLDVISTAQPRPAPADGTRVGITVGGRLHRGRPAQRADPQQRERRGIRPGPHLRRAPQALLAAMNARGGGPRCVGHGGRRSRPGLDAAGTALQRLRPGPDRARGHGVGRVSAPRCHAQRDVPWRVGHPLGTGGRSHDEDQGGRTNARRRPSVPDRQPQPAARRLSRCHRGEERLHGCGARHLHRRGHPRGPHPHRRGRWAAPSRRSTPRPRCWTGASRMPPKPGPWVASSRRERCHRHPTRPRQRPRCSAPRRAPPSERLPQWVRPGRRVRHRSRSSSRSLGQSMDGGRASSVGCDGPSSAAAWPRLVRSPPSRPSWPDGADGRERLGGPTSAEAQRGSAALAGSTTAGRQHAANGARGHCRAGAEHGPGSQGDPVAAASAEGRQPSRGTRPRIDATASAG